MQVTGCANSGVYILADTQSLMGHSPQKPALHSSTLSSGIRLNYLQSPPPPSTTVLFYESVRAQASAGTFSLHSTAVMELDKLAKITTSCCTHLISHYATKFLN